MQIDTFDGLELNNEGVRINLSGADSGLEFDSGALQVDAHDGLHRTSDGLSIDLHSDAGLTIDSGQLRVGAGDGIERTGENISIDRSSDSGLTINGSGEIHVGAGQGINRTGNDIEVDLDGNSLLRGDNGISANSAVVGFNPGVPDFTLDTFPNVEYALGGIDSEGNVEWHAFTDHPNTCLLYTSPSPRDRTRSRMPSSA